MCERQKYRIQTASVGKAVLYKFCIVYTGQGPGDLRRDLWGIYSINRRLDTLMQRPSTSLSLFIHPRITYLPRKGLPAFRGREPRQEAAVQGSPSFPRVSTVPPSHLHLQRIPHSKLTWRPHVF